jgi:hypothetical protein
LWILHFWGVVQSAGQLPLEQLIEVRILAPQPSLKLFSF